MIKTGNPLHDAAIEAVYEHGQAHVFRYWDSLTALQKEQLLTQVQSLDLNLIAHQTELLQKIGSKTSAAGSLGPAPFIAVPASNEQRAQQNRAREIGEAAIRAGKTAAFLVAGGQGTRLGFHGPKGCYPIGPVSGKTLFQMHAEKILAASRKYETAIPWAIMTSATNDAATRSFFADHDYFGLPEADIRFFPQQMIPALTADGKIILDRKDHIFMNPNGHGGSLLALMESGTIDHLHDRGVEILSYFQVDNVLINIIDPVFIGYHLLENAEMSSKMVRKNDPREKVGMFGLRDGRLQVIEYSDMPEAEMTARNSDGSLKYEAGSIAIHLINTAFVQDEIRDGFKLPYHIAHKKIPFLNESGIVTTPDKPNAYKFETFVFDALSDTTSSVIMEIIREEEFSPVKNRDGIDSAETAKRDISNYFSRWLEEAGVEVPCDEAGNVIGALEVSPLFALDKQSFLTAAKSRSIVFQDKLFIQ